MESRFSFLTIAKESEGVYKEKGSKFISYAIPVNSTEAIKLHLERLRRHHFDARHHCFAWMLGPEKSNHRASDDGEPNHSAGDPILGQIRSQDLTDILIVVVRYFGGTKLGVSGLINAYKTAAADAISHAVIIEREVFFQVRVTADYKATADVMKLIKDFDANISKQQFNDSESVLSLDIPERNREEFQRKVQLIRSMGSNIEVSFDDL